MQSGQPGPNDDLDCNVPEVPAAIPDFARAWESALQVVSPGVRRPSTLPDPSTYHEVIEPQAIFELDEKQKDGSIKTILVVPFGCERCKTIKQACSRTQPACVRCRKSNSSCEAVQGGYQILPRPKVGKPSSSRKQSTSGTCKNSKACSSAPQKPTADKLRERRMASKVQQVTQSDSGPSNRSKRPLSPSSDPVLPRKKKQTKSTSRDAEARCTVVASTEMDTECPEVSTVGPSAQVVSAAERSALKWTSVKNSRGGDEESSPEQEQLDSVPSNTPVPRVWTNVRPTQPYLKY